MAIRAGDNPGMRLVNTFFVLFAVNSLVIFLANALFPQWIVLGTATFTQTWAIIHSMGLLALVDTFAIPFVREFETGWGEMLSSKGWMVVYFLVNFVGVWAITRFSEQFGLGVTSWMVVVGLALVFDFLQGAAMMWLSKSRV